MENQMPGMPGMENTEPNEAVNGSNVKEDAAIVRPELESHKSTISNSLENIVIPKEGIKVVALRKGFYNQNRIKENDKFIVRDFKELGLWMRCEDSDLEKKKIEHLAKKKKARK